ncbi:MAG TPA: pyridoxal phosphate-dependent aminotransferase family protein [Verrucomicrobiae bacterium]|nr:pyridoxal phosphate-dependent aminotransferase family protein [Verrucomicrobiae bacterium]
MPVSPPVIEPVGLTRARFRGREFIFFGGCDYFRLASHPRVRAALAKAVEQGSISASASRVTTGTHPLHLKLETQLAEFFGAPAALLVSAGYLANSAVTQGLRGEIGLALLDERAHASLRDAARFLDCPVRTFRHRSADDLKHRAKRWRGPGELLVLTDGMFATDGAVAPLKDYLKVLPHRARFLVDDAHAAGVLGERGQGSAEHHEVSRARIIQTMTLSKAFGTFGGVVLAERELCERIRRTSTLYAGQTALPIPLAAAGLESIRLLGKQPGFHRRLRQNIGFVRGRLAGPTPLAGDDFNPILSLTPANTRQASRLRRELLRRDVYPSFIHYPGGDAGGFFRFALSSEHSRPELNALVEAVLSAVAG